MNTFAQIPVFNSEERLLTSSLAPVPDPCHAERAFLLVTSADGFLDRAKQARGKSGDARDEKIAADSAFSLLVDRHARLMYQIAYGLLRNSQDAEDAVQEAFLQRNRTAQLTRDRPSHRDPRRNGSHTPDAGARRTAETLSCSKQERKMNEFDDLLNDVLRQDGTQKPPPGMKGRILAALPAERGQLSGPRAIWVGTAAVLLIGVVGGAAWTMLRTKSGL